jgi:hypothetical protein
VVGRRFRRPNALEPTSNRPRIVPEGSGQVPRRIRPGPPRVALTPRAARRPRRGHRRGLTALPPPKRPRTHLESSSNRSRTVLEPSPNRPRRIRLGSPKDPPTVPTGRARPSRGSTPSPGHRRGRTALPPPKRPRTHLEPFSNRPRRIRPASPTGRTTPEPRGVKSEKRSCVKALNAGPPTPARVPPSVDRPAEIRRFTALAFTPDRGADRRPQACPATHRTFVFAPIGRCSGFRGSASSRFSPEHAGLLFLGDQTHPSLRSGSPQPD